MSAAHPCDAGRTMALVSRSSGGTRVCCGRPLRIRQEKISCRGKENHVPVAGTVAAF